MFYLIRFKKAYNEACKAAGVTQMKSLVRKMDEFAEEEKVLEKFLSIFFLEILFLISILLMFL